LTNGSSRELVLDALCEVLDLVQGVVLDAVQNRWIYPGCMYINVRCLWYNEWVYRSALGECLGSAMDRTWMGLGCNLGRPGKLGHSWDESQMRVASERLDPTGNLSPA